MTSQQDTVYGKIPKHWSNQTLDEISEKVTDGSHESPKPQMVGKYMCSVKDMTYNRFDFSSAKLISNEDYEKLKAQGCQPLTNDILISKDGANCLDLIFVFNQNEELVLLSSIAIVRLKREYIPKFVCYFLLSPACQYIMKNNFISGSAIPRVVLKDFKKVEILLPPLPEQKAIASVLSSLDDKIDLLHRQNKTLESIAETLFRQKFIEEADDSWEEVKLSDVCSVITKGTTPTTLGHKFVDSGVNFVKAESINDEGRFLDGKFARISEETHEFLNRSILKAGDVLCSIAGTIGRIAIVDESILPANTNQAIAILRVNGDKCIAEFVYLFLKSEAFREVMDGKVVHAVQPNLSLGEIGRTTLPLPNNEVRNRFEIVIRPIFEKKNRNSRNIYTLEKLRNTLLPKLMSGAVRVQVFKGEINA